MACSLKLFTKQRRALSSSVTSMRVGDGGEGQQIQQTSASSASANRGGNGRTRSTQDGGKGRRRMQKESLVAGGGLACAIGVRVGDELID